MDSDSDVEAYLNQLSRKTHRLKQDSRPWEDSVSSVSGADHPPDELSASSDLSLLVESRAPKTRSQQKVATGGLLSDITALSDKYSVSKDKKSPTKDRFSTLEEKYLKKYNINASPKTHEPSKDIKGRGNVAEKNKGDKFSLHATPKARTAAYYDSSEDIDENLAHYLSEVTLTSEKLESDKEGHAASNSETNDSSDDVLNLKNIINVEDLLGEEDSGGSLHESPAHYSVKSDDSVGRDKPQPGSTVREKPQSKAAKVTKDEQTGASGVTNLFASSKSSLFYSRQQEEEEEEEDEPQAAVRLLLPQASGDVFHSSRRKSSLSFDAINEGKIKLLKPSKQTTKEKTTARHKSAFKDSIATASESQISEQVPVSEEEDILSHRSDVSGGTQEPSVVSEVQENSQVSPSASIVKSEESKQGRGSRRQSISSQTRHSAATSSKSSHKKHQSHSAKDDESGHSRKSRKHSHHHHHHHHHKAKQGHKTSHRKHKESERTRKSRKKHRSPSSSSSSSSSTSLSSSESSSYTSEPSRRRSHSHKHSSRRRTGHRHWGKPPFLQHGAWPCCCLHAAHAGHAASPHTLPAFTGATSSTLLSGGGLGVEEVMQQQVALVRQFLDSQQVMYQAYTSTLVSSFRYTSLRRTEKYIKKRKPPLTFPEAYRLVKEEMEASER